jgi:hypothetical protein
VVWATDNAGEQVSHTLKETSNTLPASAIDQPPQTAELGRDATTGACTDI